MVVPSKAGRTKLCGLGRPSNQSLPNLADIIVSPDPLIGPMPSSDECRSSATALPGLVCKVSVTMFFKFCDAALHWT